MFIAISKGFCFSEPDNKFINVNYFREYLFFLFFFFVIYKKVCFQLPVKRLLYFEQFKMRKRKLLAHTAVQLIGYSIPVVFFGIINPYLPSGLCHPYQLDESISNLRGARCTVLFSSFG